MYSKNLILAWIVGILVFSANGFAWELPDTGITKCYDNTKEITCPSPGQPFYGQDAQYVTNPMSYTVSGNGTVTDTVTGLVWQQQDDEVTRTWEDAITYCENLVLPQGGYSDWRLPDEYELQSIVDYGRADPAISPFFPGTNSAFYWSSSQYAPDSGSAWGVEYQWGGFIYEWDKSSGLYVRCVRGQAAAHLYTDNGDGTVTDNFTGLIWQRQDDDVTRNWETALAYCDGLSLAGHTDWRLPDVKELRSLVDSTAYNPAIQAEYFPGTNAEEYPGYWTASTPVNHNTSAWYINFIDGYAGNTGKTNQSYARCVYGGVQIVPCVDNDQDGYGNPANPACPHPELDCDDSIPGANPGVTEVCGNQIDDNCNGQTDEGCRKSILSSILNLLLD